MTGTYTTTGPACDLACKLLGWLPSTKAISVRRDGAIIYVRGTLLKPEEWARLDRASGTESADGADVLVVVHRRQSEAGALRAVKSRSASPLLWPDGPPAWLAAELARIEREGREDAGLA